MWSLLDQNPNTVQIVASPNGGLYQRRSDGTTWRYTGTPIRGWEVLDFDPATVDIVATRTRLYRRHSNGRVWEYTGPPLTGWRLIDQNPQTVQIVATSTSLFQRHRDGRVFRYTGEPMRWELIDHNPETVEIAASEGTVFQRHRTGAIWIYTGPPITGWIRLFSAGSRAFVVSPDDTLFALQEGGVVRRVNALWARATPPEERDAAWREVDRDPQLAGIAAARQGVLFKRRNDGSVWSLANTSRAVWTDTDSRGQTVELAATAMSDAVVFKRDRDGRIWRFGGPLSMNYELAITRIHCVQKTNQGIWNLTTDDSLALDVITTVERPDGTRSQTIRPRSGIGSNWKTGLDGGPMNLPIAQITVRPNGVPTSALVSLVVLELNMSGDNFSSDRAAILEWAKGLKEAHGLASKIASLFPGRDAKIASTVGGIASVVEPFILNAIAASSNLYFPIEHVALLVEDVGIELAERSGVIDFTGHGGHYRISYEWRRIEAVPAVPLAP